MLDRFGVTFDWRGATIDGITAIAKQADETGYGYLWVPEAWGLEAFSTIGHLLSCTKKIKIGTGVINVYSRSAATIAMGCATMDQLARGRFLLGLGTSGRRLIEGWHGVKFERSLQRTKEYVEAIQKILKGGEASYGGDLLKMSGFRLFSSPPKNEIEIYLGAIGERNLALSGQIASGAIVALYPISKFEQCLKAVNQYGIKKKVFAYLPLRVVDSQSEAEVAKTELSRYIAFYIASMGKYYAQNLSNLGFGDQVQEIQNVAASRGSKEAAQVISEAFLREFCLIGSPKEILERVTSIPDQVYPVFGLNATSLGASLASSKCLSQIARSL